MGEVKFTPELLDEIINHISKGKSIVNACKLCGVDDDRFRRLRNTDPDLEARYARAKEESADVMAEEIMEIADTEPERTGPFESVDSAWVAQQRLRVDARKWIAAKLKPKKYGDKTAMEHTGPDGAPLFLSTLAPISEHLKKS